MLYFLPQQSLAFLCFVCARIQIELTATERTTKSLHAPKWNVLLTLTNKPNKNAKIERNNKYNKTFNLIREANRKLHEGKRRSIIAFVYI